MKPRFVGRLSSADCVTVTNAVIGFFAAALAPLDPGLAARLILLAAIADGLDGVLARTWGKTSMGDVLDSLSDVASFGVAPAILVFSIADAEWVVGAPSVRTIAALLVPATFLAMAVVRLGLYTTDDLDRRCTEGVPTTLAATVLAAAYLAGVDGAAVLLGATALLAYLMVTRFRYPDLRVRDALAMGFVQVLAVGAPTAFGRIVPRALLVAALCYLAFAPRYYRREPATNPRPNVADSG